VTETVIGEAVLSVVVVAGSAVGDAIAGGWSTVVKEAAGLVGGVTCVEAGGLPLPQAANTKPRTQQQTKRRTASPLRDHRDTAAPGAPEKNGSAGAPIGLTGATDPP